MNEIEWNLAHLGVESSLAKSATKQLVDETIRAITEGTLDELQDGFFKAEHEMERIKREVEESQQYKDLKIMVSAMRETIKPYKTANKLRLHFIEKAKANG